MTAVVAMLHDVRGLACHRIPSLQIAPTARSVLSPESLHSHARPTALAAVIDIATGRVVHLPMPPPAMLRTLRIESQHECRDVHPAWRALLHPQYVRQRMQQPLAKY